MLSPSDTAIVFLIALLLFGPEQLPRIARQVGEVMRHMQNTTQTFVHEMERAARASEAQPTTSAPPLPPPSQPQDEESTPATPPEPASPAQSPAPPPTT